MVVIGVLSIEKESMVIRILRKIISSQKIKASIIETYDDCISAPNKFNLKSYIHEIKNSGIDIAIIKIISDYIATGIYNDISFDLLIQETFSTEENETLFQTLLKVKETFLKSLNDKCITIINGDDETVLKIFKNIKMCVITYGFGTKATITASSIAEESDFIVFIYCIQRMVRTVKNNYIEPQEFPVKILTTQRNDIYNALAAVTAAIVCGIDTEKNITSKFEIS